MTIFKHECDRNKDLAKRLLTNGRCQKKQIMVEYIYQRNFRQIKN
ncbi:hypothetical protein [Calothrix sp. 336/3]|nr:hypothetical protein [Calothrix sp. 336/3]